MSSRQTPVAVNASENLVRSTRWCAQVMRIHAKSFYFSTRVLPRAKREAVEALYGLFRSADDLADEPGPTLEERRAGFAEIRACLQEIAAGARSVGVRSAEAPWSAAVARALERFPIAMEDIFALLAGCESDIDPQPISTYPELESYARAVAGTVGRCSMAILGASDEDSLARGERLGIAMQYTNILRDVAEDERNGRCYLPQRETERIGRREVMRTIAQLARTDYRQACVLAARVPNDGSRWALLATADIYGGIVDEVERRDFNPEAGRAVVRTREKIARAMRCWASAYIGFASMR